MLGQSMDELDSDASLLTQGQRVAERDIVQFVEIDRYACAVLGGGRGKGGNSIYCKRSN